MKINKVLSATISTALKYDNDVKTFDNEGVKKALKCNLKRYWVSDWHIISKLL